jgi:hypothetical protein
MSARQKKSKPTALEVKTIIDGMEPNEQAILFQLFLLESTGPIGRRVNQLLEDRQRKIDDLMKMQFPEGTLTPLPPTYQRTDDKKKNGAAKRDAVKQARYRKNKRIKKIQERYVDHVLRTNDHIEFPNRKR